MSIDKSGKPVSCHLAIGTNLGDRAANVRRALALLRENGVHITRVSPVVETAAVGGPAGQGVFYNLVVAAEVECTARQLLLRLQQIERDMGRVRTEKNGPRVIDLDILSYGKETILEKGLIVPHPRLQGRMFVLAPWAAIAPDFVVPKLNQSVQQLRDALDEPVPVVVEGLPL